MCRLENEEKLIAGCRAGDDAARELLYRRYSKQLMAVCYRYTGSMDDALDVLHDGFIKIFTHFTFRGESALATWLTKVMISQAVDYLRKKHRFISLFGEVDDGLEEVPDDDNDIVFAGSRLTEQELLQLVAELPEGCRTVFNLFVIDGKTHREIAEMLHIKEHSSTSQYHRARKILKDKIKAYESNEANG